MKYISIGCACNVKYQIDKHKHKIKTLFFDWLMTSMNSVITILNCNNIDNLLYFDNIIEDNTRNCGNNSCVVIKSLDLCVSIHDLMRDYTKDDVLEFIGKYKRRFERVVKYIKSDEKIYFIRCGSVNNNDIKLFNETILKINPNCNFALVIVDNNKLNKPNDVELVKYDHCLYMGLNIDKPEQEDWTSSYLNWKKIFLDIENNI